MRFAAYAIPTLLFVWVLYWNYSPLGYNKTYTIDVGSDKDLSGRLHLEEAPTLGERTNKEDGTTTRTLLGATYAVFSPEFVLRDTRLIFEIIGKDAFMMPLSISYDYSRYKWDYLWNFTQESLPKNLKGQADLTDSCAQFNGTDHRLELPGSKDMFESEAFSIYAKWRPDNQDVSNQQIIGHYNWELYQNKDSVEFRVGRMNDKAGKFYSLKAPLLVEPAEFFGYEHTALAIYNPDPKGAYIDLYVDEQYRGRTYIGNDRIWADYNNDKNLTLGKSDHGSAQYFKGCIYEAGIKTGVVVKQSKKVSFRLDGPEDVQIPIMSTKLAEIDKIILHVENK